MTDPTGPSQESVEQAREIIQDSLIDRESFRDNLHVNDFPLLQHMISSALDTLRRERDELEKKLNLIGVGCFHHIGGPMGTACIPCVQGYLAERDRYRKALERIRSVYVYDSNGHPTIEEIEDAWAEVEALLNAKGEPG